jgi:hypothetical protein
LYFSSYIIRIIKSRRIIWAGHVGCMGGKRNTYRVLVRKTEGKRPRGRPRRRRENNIKIYLREIRLGNLYWIHLAQDKDQWRAL